MTDLTSGPASLSATKQTLLAQRLRRRGAASVIARRAAEMVPPLSFAQERLWFMEQLAPGSAAHTIPVALRLRGPLDADALRRALRDLADRHETLRMSYPADADDRPGIRIRAAGEMPLSTVAADSVAAAQDIVGAVIAEPFDIANGPVARAALVSLASDDHVFALAIHHIAGDGWSVDVLLADLFALYEAHRANAPSNLPEPSIGYGDYAIWQRGRPGHDADHAYWAGQLAGLPNLDLVTDRIRPPEQTYNGAAHGFRLDRTLTDAVKALADRSQATPYMVVLAAFQALLASPARSPAALRPSA